MVKWINHVAIAAPRNGSTSHTVDPSSGTVAAGTLFTPTAGNFLVVLCGGAVTSTTPSGWTLPAGGSIVNNAGLYLWYRTAAGADTVTTTHNASDYPVLFDFYEFPADSSFIGASAQGNVASGATGPSLSGLTASANFRAGVACQDIFGTTAPSYTWSSGTESVDTGIIASGTDGYGFSVTYLEDQADATFSSAATSTVGSPTIERIVFAVNAAAPASGSQAATGTIAATSVAQGSPVARHVAAGVIAALTAVSGAPSAIHPATGSITVASTAAGSPTASHPATSSVAATTTAAGSPTARHPATGAIAAASASAGAAGILPGSGSLAATGTIAITSTANGSPSLRHAATGTVGVTSVVAGAPRVRFAAAGTCAAIASANGSPAGRYTAAGTVVVVTAASGSANVFDPTIPPLPTDGVSLSVDTGNRGLTLTAEARSLEVST